MMDGRVSDEPQYVKYKVFCRVRPHHVQGKREHDVSHTITNTGEEKQILSVQHRRVITTKNPRRIEKTDYYDFRYDEVFGMETTQEQVFEKVGVPMIDEFKEGTNGTIFAYGQTGTGKTHTIYGSKKNDGMLPRSFEYLFKEITSDSRNEYEITVQYIELYNERIYDLLAGFKHDQKPNTKLYHDKDGKKEITVHRVRDLQQAINIYKKGFEMRRTAKTLKNQNSSRSHTICSIFLTKNNENNSKTCSELNLVDLAGSEQYHHNGSRWSKESQQINLSLFHLKSLLTNLSKRRNNKEQRFSYRNALLTRILKEALSGNSLCAMVATVALDSENIDQTINTCRFSGTVATIRNFVSRNMIPDKFQGKSHLSKDELDKLRDMEKKCNEKSETINELERANAASKLLIDDLNEQLESKTIEIELLKNKIADLQQCTGERRIDGKDDGFEPLPDTKNLDIDKQIRTRIKTDVLCEKKYDLIEQLKFITCEIKLLKNKMANRQQCTEERRTNGTTYNGTQIPKPLPITKNLDIARTYRKDNGSQILKPLPITKKLDIVDEQIRQRIRERIKMDDLCEKKDKFFEKEELLEKEAFVEKDEEKKDIDEQHAYGDRTDGTMIDQDAGGEISKFYNGMDDDLFAETLTPDPVTYNPWKITKKLWNHAVGMTYNICRTSGVWFWRPIDSIKNLLVNPCYGYPSDVRIGMFVDVGLSESKVFFK